MPKKDTKRDKFIKDPRWVEMKKEGWGNLTDEQIYQKMKSAGLLKDYPELENG